MIKSALTYVGLCVWVNSLLALNDLFLTVFVAGETMNSLTSLTNCGINF